MRGRTPLVVLAGPTASGKSELALRLAGHLPLEIVTADSQQVYAGLDIGTAKPSTEERARVPHHLLDVAPVNAQLTAARFVELADEAIEGIVGAGRLPLVVGGSGLWLRALLRGLSESPQRDDALRQSLLEEEAAGGSGILHARLREVDPVTADRLHRNDLVRIVRALEVHELTGEPISSHHAEHRFASPRYRHRFLALDVERAQLRARIERRTTAMLRGGWMDEVRELLEQGVSRERLESVLGYGEIVAHLEGEIDRARLEERIVTRTWHYSKRQVMWLRKEPDVEWLRPPVDAAALADELRRWLER